MEMQVLGTYHNLGAFLESIKELPRIVNVTKLKVDTRGSSAGGEDSLSSTIGATYEATTFVYREVAETVPATNVKAKR